MYVWLLKEEPFTRNHIERRKGSWKKRNKKLFFLYGHEMTIHVDSYQKELAFIIQKCYIILEKPHRWDPNRYNYSGSEWTWE